MPPAVARAVPPQLLESPFRRRNHQPRGQRVRKCDARLRHRVGRGVGDGKGQRGGAVQHDAAAPKALAIDGGATTAILADAVAPVPPWVEVTLPVVLFLAPAAVPVTFTLNVQVPPPWVTVAPDKLITLVPWMAVIVPGRHVPLSPLGVEITRSAGSVSLKPTPVRSVVPLLLVTVKVSEVEPFSGMLSAPNCLLIPGGDTTVSIAVLLVAPVPPSFELRAPVVLLCTPALVSVTFTFRVQEPLDPTVPPLRPTEVALAVGENVPPHVLLAFGMPATVMPLGSPSLNVSPLRETHSDY